jgi:hypothetical protein
MFNLGSAIGSAPAQRRDQQAKSTAMTMVNEALASQDPNQIQSAAVALQKAGMNAEAMELSKAAGQLRAKAQETGIGRQLQSGLNAITSAARRGVPFEDLTKLQDSVVKFGGTNEQINAAYKSGIQKQNQNRTSKIQDIYNPETGQMQKVEFFYEDGVPVGNPRVLGISEEPGDVTVRYGLNKDSTEEDYDNAIYAAIDNKQPTIATTIQRQKSEKFPDAFPTLEALKIAETIDPEFNTHIEYGRKAEKINTLIRQGGAGSQQLIKRELTSFTPNDVKAVSELARFDTAKGLGRRVQDGFTKFFSGQESEITNQEYQAMAEAMAELAEQRMVKTINTMYAGGDEDAADKLMDMFVNSTAKVIGIN